MKKLNFLLLGAAALAMASCSQEDVVNPGAGGDGNFHVSVNLPDDMRTRAFSDGYTADELHYAVYEVDSRTPITTGQTSFKGALSTTVDFNLASNKQYQIAFFAQSAASDRPDLETYGAYTFDANAGVIRVDYTKMTSAANNADAYDCFFWLYTTPTIGKGQTTGEVVLHRPVAQVNWGTNDMDKDAVTSNGTFGSNPAANMVATLTTAAYTEYGFFEGTDGSGDVVQKPANLALVSFAAPLGEKFPVEGYEYVNMSYLLAPQGGANYDLELAITNTAGTYQTDNVIVNNAPVQANYRTNIYGNLLTENLQLTVTKDPSWETPDYDVEVLETFTMDAADLDGATISESGIYKLTGELDGIYKINVQGVNPQTRAAEGLEVVIDGSGLKAKEGKKFNLMFLDDVNFPHSSSSITANYERLGYFTFQNFKEGTINFKSGNTTVNVKNNTLDCFILAAGNVNVNMSGNTINSENGIYQRWDNSTCKYNAYLYIVDYDLSFNNNTLTQANGTPFCINGWTLNDPVGSFSGPEMLNLNKINSFSGNTITVSELETDQKDWTAAISFMGDGTYYVENATTTPTYSPAATAFMQLVKDSNNTINAVAPALGGYMFKFTEYNSWDAVRVDIFNAE